MNPTGILVPIVTPFSDGAIDFESVDRLVERLISDGVSGLVVLGTTGESLALDQAEGLALADHVIDRAAGAVPVYVGVSGAATHKVTKAIAAFEGLAAAGYLVSCPYYNRPPQDGLLLHFERVADATAKEIIVYNIPSRTAVNMSNDVLLALAEQRNVVGVKDCCGSLPQSFELLGRRSPGFSVLTGEDALLLTMLAHGGDGGILASAHVGTSHFVELFDAVRRNDLDRARVVWSTVASLITTLFAEPNPMPIKYWLWRAGVLASPECRAPLTGVSEGLKATIDARIAALGAPH